MQPNFVTKPAFAVVGLLLRTAPKSPDISNLWEKFVPRMGEIPHATGQHDSYGLMDHYDHVANAMDYMAGNPVSQVGPLPAGMTTWTVPANTYAVFPATMSTLGAVFDEIFATWLNTSGYQLAPGPYFEHYGSDFNPTNPVVSIYIPIIEQLVSDL